MPTQLFKNSTIIYYTKKGIPFVTTYHAQCLEYLYLVQIERDCGMKELFLVYKGQFL